MKQERHGLRYHPLYSKYYDIKSRLRRDERYKDVSMCEEWSTSFKAFYDWSLDNGWNEGLEIDRFPDIRGNYEPSNCRYVTKLGQNQNKGKYKSKQEYACIRKQNKQYIVRVQVNKKRVKRAFYDLNEAIKFRNDIKGNRYVDNFTK